MTAKQKIPRRPGGRRNLAIGLCLLGLIALLCLLAPVLSRYGPLEQDLYAALQPPSPAHPLGTDQLGRDMLSRVLHAGRADLAIMVLAELAPFLIGTFLGMLAGCRGGWAEWLLGLVTDVFIAFPYYLLVIVVAFATGAGVKGIFITFLLVGWILYARVARGVAGGFRSSEWLQAARLLGYSEARILWREIFPNVLPQVVVVLMTDMAALLVMIVTLGYLGIGIAPPTPDWGTMIAEGQGFMTSAWWLSVFPGVMVVCTGVALAFVGDGLADLWR